MREPEVNGVGHQQDQRGKVRTTNLKTGTAKVEWPWNGGSLQPGSSDSARKGRRASREKRSSGYAKRFLKMSPVQREEI